jgi:uncharacterized protein YbaA (DUF1428 family)
MPPPINLKRWRKRFGTDAKLHRHGGGNQRESDMAYIQGFLVPVRNENKAKYTDMARMGSRIFKKNGATSVVECWGVDVPDGKVTSFPMAVKLEENETVVFSWIVWPDAETAKTGMDASMKDFETELGPEMANMPLDGMRMMWGGFETIVED